MRLEFTIYVDVGAPLSEDFPLMYRSRNLVPSPSLRSPFPSPHSELIFVLVSTVDQSAKSVHH